MSKPTVFISYSHKDEDWKNRLVTHLKVLENESLLEEWDDRRIGAGKDWYHEIEETMERCSIAMLMVSPDFLTSKFIRSKEVPRLLQRRWNEGVRIFPLIVRPCAWKQVKWLARMQVCPTDGRPLSGGSDHQIDADLAAITEEVASVIRRCAPPSVAEGYVPLAPDKISLAKLPSTSPDLFGREEELAMLDEAWSKPETNIVEFVAWGGVGKTALVNKWLLQMGKDNYRGAERVLGWSFYSQGAAEGKQVSADLFIAAALEWFGDPDPTKGSPWDKGERLAELVRKQRTLLVLDGLEPLQYPPGEMGGRVKDPGLQGLLRELAHYNPGLCILTTRLPVDDIKDFIGTWVERIPLEDLSPEAGAELLRNLGIKGAADELKQAAGEFGGHALALTLLGSYVAVVYSGDIRQRDKIPRLTAEKKQGGHAIRVMECYERWFRGKPELDILRIMGLFDRPAEGGAIAALRAKRGIKGLTSEVQKLSHENWQYTVSNLRIARLLATEDPQSPDTLDAHPLVREHFGDRLKESNPQAWKKAHSRLYDYYKSSAKEFPATIEEMAPLYAAVAHGCQAGRHQEALDEVYYPRIQRRREAFSMRKLGAVGAELAALSGFFDRVWHEPVAKLREQNKGYVLSEAGFRLRALGRLAEAAQPMQAGMQAYVARKDWRNAARAASNLSEVYVSSGKLAEGLRYAQQSVELADRSGDPSHRSIMRTTLADALHQAGQLEEAAALFGEAEKIQREWQPKFTLLYSLPGFYYCDLLLAVRRYRDVLDRIGHTLEWMTRDPNAPVLTVALDHLSLGRAHLLQAEQEGAAALANAETHTNRAVDGLRESGHQDYLPRGLLARAELHRVQRQFGQAQRDLDEAMTIATRGGMGLHQADCHLEYARLYLAMGEKDKGQESLATAKEMIGEMGYHRRDKEVRQLDKQLGKKPKKS